MSPFLAIPLFGIAWLTVGTVIFVAGTLVLSAVSTLLRKSPTAPNLSHDSMTRTVTVRQPVAPWRIVYGRARIGGIITFVDLTGSSNEFLQMVVTLAGHQLQSIDAMYFDGVLVPLDGSGNATGKFAGFVHVEYNLGTTGQSAFAGLLAADALWTVNHKQSGRAGAYIQLKWSADLFQNGIPNISFDVKGNPNVFDPRTSVTQYTENPALCMRDYLLNTSFGLGASASEIDDVQAQAAANSCDELVSILAGGTEKRYLMNGTFEASTKPVDVLQSMLTSMAGRLVYTGGTFRIFPGVYQTPSISLAEGDIVGPIKVQTRMLKRDLFNGVKGIFVFPSQNWAPTDFPGYQSAAYLAEDQGEVLWKDVEYPWTISAPTAQRLAKIDLERVRRQVTVNLTCKLSAYQIGCMDTIQLSLARYGWVNKTFEVTDFNLVTKDAEQDGPLLLVDLVLRETDANVFAWTTANEKAMGVPAGTPAFPDPGTVGAPTGLTLASGDVNSIVIDGVRTPRILVTWTAPTDRYVVSGGRIYVFYKKQSDAGYSPLGYVNGSDTTFYIDQVAAGIAYNVQLIPENAMGVKGSPVTAGPHTVVCTVSTIDQGVGPTGSGKTFGQLLYGLIPNSEFDLWTGGGGAGTPSSDNFQRASLGSNWSVPAGSFAISGNVDVMPTGAAGARSLAYYNAVTWPNDQYSQCTITNLGSSPNDIGPAVRVGASGTNAYCFYYDNGIFYLFKIVAGTVTVLQQVGGTLAIYDVLRLEVLGTTLTAKRNGTQILTATDSDLASGNAGLNGFGGASSPQHAAPWSGGSLIAGTAVIASWLVDPAGTVAQDSSPVSGPYDLQYTTSTLNSWQGINTGFVVPLRQNAEYRIRIALKTNLGGQARLRVYFNSGDLTNYAEKVFSFAQAGVWYVKEMLFTLPSSAQSLSRVSVEFNGGGTSVVYNVDSLRTYEDAPSYFQIGPANASYRPLTNPLTAVDAGSNATINIASFVMRVAGNDFNISSGAITALTYDTLYYVYYDDSTFAGGAVTFNVTLVKETALNGAGRFFVGSIHTPIAGGNQSIGNNDGGAGAQSGALDYYRPTLAIDGAVFFANPANVWDVDATTFAEGNAHWDTSTTTTAVETWYAFPAMNVGLAVSVVLRVISSVRNVIVGSPTALPNPAAKVEWSVDAGATWSTLWQDGTGTRAKQMDSVTLSSRVNLARLRVRAWAIGGAIGGTGGSSDDLYVDVYEIFVEVQS
jgi:hypothetical protein